MAQVFGFTSIVAVVHRRSNKVKDTQHWNFVVNELNSRLLSAVFQLSVTPCTCPSHTRPKLFMCGDVNASPVCVDAEDEEQGASAFKIEFSGKVSSSRTKCFVSSFKTIRNMLRTTCNAIS